MWLFGYQYPTFLISLCSVLACHCVHEHLRDVFLGFRGQEWDPSLPKLLLGERGRESRVTVGKVMSCQKRVSPMADPRTSGGMTSAVTRCDILSPAAKPHGGSQILHSGSPRGCSVPQTSPCRPFLCSQGSLLCAVAGMSPRQELREQHGALPGRAPGVGAGAWGCGTALTLPSCLQAGSGAPITCCLRERESSN